MLAWSMTMHRMQRTRIGHDAALLSVGDHPSMQHLHRLGLSCSALQGVAIPEASLHISDHAEVM